MYGTKVAKKKEIRNERGRERPEEVIHKPLHAKKVTAWAALRNIPTPNQNPLPQENEEPITITSECYIKLAPTPFWEELGEREEQWLQQDEATPHTARTSLDWLDHFPGRHILPIKNINLNHQQQKWRSYSI